MQNVRFVEITKYKNVSIPYEITFLLAVFRDTQRFPPTVRFPKRTFSFSKLSPEKKQPDAKQEINCVPPYQFTVTFMYLIVQGPIGKKLNGKSGFLETRRHDGSNSDATTFLKKSAIEIDLQGVK